MKRLAVLFFILCPLFYSCIKNNKSKPENDSPPGRIISLGPYITEEIYLLGKGGSLVADTVYCTKPADADKKQKIGNLVEINIEKIYSLKPDIVFATGLTYPQNINKLKSLGIKTVVMPQAKSFDEICGQFQLLGRYLHEGDRAAEIVAKSRKIVGKIRTLTGKIKNKKKIFFQIGADPLWAVNKDSFMNDFIEFGGGINIAYNSGIGPYSREKVVEQNPDIIVIIKMGIQNDREERDKWMKLGSINAVKTGSIFVIDPYEVCSATPVSFAESLKELAVMFYPGLKEEIASIDEK